MFQGLTSLRFCSTFSSQNLWLFCRRELSLSEPFFQWFLMVWAPIWRPKPSRRPSRRHPQKNLNFDTYFFLIFGCFGDPLEHPKSQKNVRMHLGGGPILAPKAPWEENEAPGSCFKAFWLPKLVFWQRFLSFFWSYWAVGAATAWDMGFPTMHLPNRLSNHAFAKWASQWCTCQPSIQSSICEIGVSLGYLPNMRPKHTLAK